MKVAFLRSFTVKEAEDSLATDMIGYGKTVPGAIMEEMENQGVDVVDVNPAREEIELPRAKLKWIYNGYEQVANLLAQGGIDFVFIFHIFHHFSSELRRIICDMKSEAKLVGYTHGSHWDPRDTFRFIVYPDLKFADLGNLHSLDKIYLVSEYSRKVLNKEIAKLNPDLSKQIDSKFEVVGLPINTRLIDQYETEEKFEKLTVVFNHNLISSKNPQMFARVMDQLLETHDLQVIFTRSYCEDEEISATLEKLKSNHPDDIVLLETPPVDRYYPVLWKSDLQISTATHETLGVATLEAMYTNTCCVLPDHCSYPEITDYYEECLYQYDEREFYNKLEYLIEDESARSKIGEELKKRSDRYSPKNVTANILKAMEN